LFSGVFLLRIEEMTKAQYILCVFIDSRKLKELCENLNLSYSYVQQIAHGAEPSMSVARKLRPIIYDLSFWDDEADAEFRQLYRENNVKIINDARSSYLIDPSELN
jgi:transcriptional regulator with XRE-family HTH domain